MQTLYTNTIDAKVRLRHVSRRSESVTIAAGEAYCDSSGQVIGFMLGLQGHRDARDPNIVWDAIAISGTPVGDRLVYVLADTRRPGDLSEQLANAFFGAAAVAAVEALGRSVAGRPAANTAERMALGEWSKAHAEPMRQWLTDKWRTMRPTDPNEYINMETREPVWRGMLALDKSVPTAPLV